MYEFDFLKAIQNQILIYRDFPLPVVICNKEFRVYWSNDLARHFFLHITDTEGLRQALAEFSTEELYEVAVKTGNCTVQEVFPFSGVNMSVTPIFRGEEAIGMTLVFLRMDNLVDSKHIHQTSRMAGALSDSIREVVNEVFAALDLAALKSDFMNAGWMKQGLNTVAYNNYRILRIASNITEFARYQSGLMGLSPRLVNLTSFLADIEETVRSVTEQTEVPVTFNLPKEEIILQLDVATFERAFMNVLHNALYYSKPGNVITVTLLADPPKEEVLVRVKDRGLGIPKSVLPDITRAYFVHNHRGGVGRSIGLGLTIANLITEAHGGRLRIVSKKGSGTMVDMIFPVGNVAIKPLSLEQNLSSSHLADRFSPAYIGLCDVIISPYRGYDSPPELSPGGPATR